MNLLQSIDEVWQVKKEQGGKGSSHSKKKISVNFPPFGPDPPPPLKSVKLNKIFFSYTLTETYFGKRNLFSHLKT